MSILQANQLVKSFGRRRVVDGVSLQVRRGEIVGLLGPNGAGKTTTFRMICGLLQPDSGTVTLAGKDVTDWPMFQRARHGGMGYLPQQFSFFAKLTVQQNLLCMMELLKMDRKTQKKRCDELLEQFQIGRLRKSKAGKLSGGEKRRLEIARCLVSDPEIIMLDEPFAGIDPVTVQNIQEVIKNLRDSGISILITDHAAREILQITDRTYVVSEGQILCSGSAEEIVQHEEVKRKYLGEISFTKKEQTRPQNDPVTTIQETERESMEPETDLDTTQESQDETDSTTETKTNTRKKSKTKTARPRLFGRRKPVVADTVEPETPKLETTTEIDLPTTDDTPKIAAYQIPNTLTDPVDKVIEDVNQIATKVEQTIQRNPVEATVEANAAIEYVESEETIEDATPRRTIRRPRITKIDTFDSVKAPFSSKNIE